jgi:hypothetical protein
MAFIGVKQENGPRRNRVNLPLKAVLAAPGQANQYFPKMMLVGMPPHPARVPGIPHRRHLVAQRCADPSESAEVQQDAAVFFQRPHGQQASLDTGAAARLFSQRPITASRPGHNASTTRLPNSATNRYKIYLTAHRCTLAP